MIELHAGAADLEVLPGFEQVAKTVRTAGDLLSEVAKLATAASMKRGQANDG